MSHSEVYELGERLAYEEAVLLRSTVSAKRLAGKHPALLCALDAHRRSMSHVVALRCEMSTHLHSPDEGTRDAAFHAMVRVSDSMEPYVDMLWAS